MAASCWLLADGCWLLTTGCWLLAVGCWLLAAECLLLAADCWLLADDCWVVDAGSCLPAWDCLRLLAIICDGLRVPATVCDCLRLPATARILGGWLDFAHLESENMVPYWVPQLGPEIGGQLKMISFPL